MRALVFLLASCAGEADPPSMSPDKSLQDSPTESFLPDEELLTITAVDPSLADPIGGSTLTVSGTGFGPDAIVTLGGIPATVLETSESSLVLLSPPVGGDEAALVIARGAQQASATVEVWSPASLPGARLFDAASGVIAEEAVASYEWQRLTAEIASDWRVRDGNTLSWLPSAGRFLMVGGWNGLQEPDGFSSVPPDSIYPPENTTDEVWSSADGVSWTLELPHGHGAFERRHIHNTVLWRDALWLIGGDSWQGYYNHDVLTSTDGATWTAVLPPGSPPWTPRAAQISGVFDGFLWTGGGQELLSDPAGEVFRNDLWRSADGIIWEQVAADGPGSETRWAGCGFVDGFVEFLGQMWLVGCARYDEVAGHTMYNDVWSTADGLTWTKHAEPPWSGKIFDNVVVWDGLLWVLFGYTAGDPDNGWPAGNASEAWYSEDGETWTSLPKDAPVPGSHAQGVAVTDDFLLIAGGNYSFGFGDGFDKSVWRLVPWHGLAVRGWTDRGSDALALAAPDDVSRPVLVQDAFGVGSPGMQFDGSASVLSLDAPDAQSAGRTVLWVARTPYTPLPWGWEETYAPISTVIGGLDETGYPSSSIGTSGGRIVMVNREEGVGVYGEPLWARVEGGEGLQEGPGRTLLLGLTHATDGTVEAFVDGASVETEGTASFASPRSWSQLGGSMEDGYYGPNTRLSGTLGMVLVLPGVADAATLARIHEWARGRFGVKPTARR